MKRLATIERYLTAHTAETGSAADGSASRVRPFFTISRQAGAGGHLLAETLLDVFDRQEDKDLFGGWQVFDRKLCEIVAGDPTYSQSMSALLDEEYRTKPNELFQQLLGPTVDQDLLMHRVFDVVSAVASIGKGIIIGRAASEVTREMSQGTSVRLIAPEEVRIRGTMEHYGLDERAARDKARTLDRSRARLLKTHFQVDIDDPTRYDIIYNTGRMPFEEIAECLMAVLRHRVAAAKSEVPL